MNDPETQLIALAAILASVNLAYESAFETLQSEESPQSEESIVEECQKAYKAKEDKDRKIPRWYWCGVFGEMYAGAAGTQIANDFSEVTSWLREEIDLPSTVGEATFQSNRLLEVQSRASAIYKGVYALLIPNGCRDFLTASPIDEQISSDGNIDIHHIFPRDWCQNQRIESNVFNSIINKTALSASTNRKIGRRAPSEYLREIQKESATIDKVKMDEILTSHLISADALRADKFWVFFKARKEALLKAIEKAVGKKVTREDEV